MNTGQEVRTGRNIGFWITGISAILCGVPGLLALCLGFFAALGSQMPEAMASSESSVEDVLVGSLVFICIGGLGIAIPMIAAVVSFSLMRNEAPAVNERGPTSAPPTQDP